MEGYQGAVVGLAENMHSKMKFEDRFPSEEGGSKKRLPEFKAPYERTSSEVKMKKQL